MQIVDVSFLRERLSILESFLLSDLDVEHERFAHLAGDFIANRAADHPGRHLAHV